jgi:hypothetical protein
VGIRVLGIVALVLGAVVLTTGDAPAGSRRPIPVDPGLATAAAAANALEQTPPIGPGSRVTLVGDSLADSVSWGFVPAARARGLDASAVVVPGCGLIRGSVVAPNGDVVPWSPACEERLAARTIPEMAAHAADVYLWVSTWEPATHLVDGVTYDSATPAGRSGLAALVRETADQLAPPGSGRHVVFAAPALPATSEKGDPSPQAVTDTRALQAILTEVVRGDPSRFSLVRFNRILCPAGILPCPTTFADGATPRAADGGHFERAGSDWFAPQLLDLLGVPG